MTTVNNIANAVLKSQKSSSTSAYDTSATVTRVTDDAVFVHIDGGVPETPCQKTIDCKAGDIVKIRISGGKAWITGNATAPPTDDTKATAAHAAAGVAYEAAESAAQNAVTASKTATDAKIIAEAINQFFWHDANGAHVTEIPQEDWLSNPSGNNILMNVLGVLIRSGLIASASFSASAITFYAPDGTTEIAKFSTNGITIGAENDVYARISNGGLSILYGGGVAE
jgi:hypothetical protein